MTTPPELRRSPDRANSDRPSDLRSSGGVVKRGPRRLKIGVQSRFGPNSTVKFEAVFRKILGWPINHVQQQLVFLILLLLSSTLGTKRFLGMMMPFLGPHTLNVCFRP